MTLVSSVSFVLLYNLSQSIRLTIHFRFSLNSWAIVFLILIILLNRSVSGILPHSGLSKPWHFNHLKCVPISFSISESINAFYLFLRVYLFWHINTWTSRSHYLGETPQSLQGGSVFSPILLECKKKKQNNHYSNESGQFLGKCIYWGNVSCHYIKPCKLIILLPSRIMWRHLFRSLTSSNLLLCLSKSLFPISWKFITFFGTLFSTILSTWSFHYVLYSSIF